MIRQNFFRCGMTGWALEILWTGLHAFRVRDLKLIGNSSLWMFPIYGSAAFLTPIMQKMRNAPLVQRGFVYMSCIFLGEYVSGMFLKHKNMCPWDYSRTPWHLNGVIRLDYAPVWFLVGLLYERLLLRKVSTKLSAETS
ncbi:MAG: hypothetical protein HFI13_13020 [Lachnospiraceae bacterium]|nr:hypothetical protein [Lachnospiraceae bacterium]